MKRKTLVLLMTTLAAALMLSACGSKTLTGAPQNQNAPSNTAGVSDPSPANTNSGNNSENSANSGNEANGNQNDTTGNQADANDAANGDILIVIDQTPKPLAEGGSFDFTVKKAPEGYMLKEIHWKSKKNDIVNTLEEAIQHGQNGGDGFYISGNGQFMGFLYPDEMKGEEGKVTFVFGNDQGQELTWEKDVTLK
ncbi:hypothetical protein M0651_23120 [Paenibacillus sp. MBLB2552]|uniref:DUF4352 domain-containing protein n=2 Tax=Paenibacillus mellifer TaxID=2937794 RepID=A0A9X1Y5Z9_9BACL|nr:hypothetical protein [Paenibacillus mellifer]